MRLLLERHTFHRSWTIGTLYVDFRPYCFTLEDADRLAVGLEKVYGATAIPEGDYLVEITWSEKFERALPIVKDVPGFTGVRFHTGNTAADTEGCVIVGRKAALGRVMDSRLAFAPLFLKMQVATREKVEILLSVRSESYKPNMDRLKEQWEGKDSD
jgi:hypothetical protein